MSQAQPHVLVTGGAGFIGSNLVERLVDDGRSVRVVDNLSTGSRHNLAHLDGRFEFLEGDIRERSACDAAVAGVDTVFHVAALPSVPRSMKDPEASHDHNVNATLRLLEAARAAGVRRVVYSSSSSVYGDTETLPKVETFEPLPQSPYATSKLAAEQYVLAYARAGLVEGVALRYFNVFGPRQDPNSAYAAVIPAFLQAVTTGQPARIFGDGEQTRDFTYIENVIHANLAAAEAPEANGTVVNIGSGQRTSLNTLLEMIEQVAGGQVERIHEANRPGDVRHSLASLERAGQAIGYRPQVDLQEGIRRLHGWWADVGSQYFAAR